MAKQAVPAHMKQGEAEESPMSLDDSPAEPGMPSWSKKSSAPNQALTSFSKQFEESKGEPKAGDVADMEE